MRRLHPMGLRRPGEPGRSAAPRKACVATALDESGWLLAMPRIGRRSNQWHFPTMACGGQAILTVDRDDRLAPRNRTPWVREASVGHSNDVDARGWRCGSNPAINRRRRASSVAKSGDGGRGWHQEPSLWCGAALVATAHGGGWWRCRTSGCSGAGATGASALSIGLAPAR